MNEEIDELWTVDLFGQYSHWVSKEEYQIVRALLLDADIDKAQTAISFKTVNDAEIVILLANISNLTYTTRETRKESRRNIKLYEEEWKEKNEWEE